LAAGMEASAAILEGWAFLKGDAALHQILRNVAALVLLLFALGALLTRKTGKGAGGRWLPSPDAAPAKRACEVWFLRYGAVWILCFAIIIVTRVYDQWGSRGYFFALGGLMAPLLLQPVLLPAATCDGGKPLLERYSFKANLWMLVFGFIGNYWYTHYFYNVLKASYTMQSWDLNGVPIPMFFATHFYFCFYHTLSNMALRKVVTTYTSGWARDCFTVALVCAMSYITAFMEALTISGYSCYSFEDRHMAWVYGSAFYGIYFLVSFPMFFRLDEPAEHSKKPRKVFSAFDTAVESLATGMAVLLLLDFVRVGLGVQLTVWLQRPCKLDASLTCAPFAGQPC